MEIRFFRNFSFFNNLLIFILQNKLKSRAVILPEITYEVNVKSWLEIKLSD